MKNCSPEEGYQLALKQELNSHNPNTNQTCTEQRSPLSIRSKSLFRTGCHYWNSFSYHGKVSSVKTKQYCTDKTLTMFKLLEKDRKLYSFFLVMFANENYTCLNSNAGNVKWRCKAVKETVQNKKLKNKYKKYKTSTCLYFICLDSFL